MVKFLSVRNPPGKVPTLTIVGRSTTKQCQLFQIEGLREPMRKQAFENLDLMSKERKNIGSSSGAADVNGRLFCSSFSNETYGISC